jgi:hypothetical protein
MDHCSPRDETRGAAALAKKAGATNAHWGGGAGAPPLKMIALAKSGRIDLAQNPMHVLAGAALGAQVRFGSRLCENATDDMIRL